MATPHVTGGAALVIAQFGKIGPAQVRERLLLSAMSGPIAGDPDAYPEPILNVASLGKGTITAPSSAKPGQRIGSRPANSSPARWRVSGSTRSRGAAKRLRRMALLIAR